MTESNALDLIIVGAGLVGTSVIVGLQKAGFRITVLEKHLPAIIDVDKEDQRPLTLAYGGQRCLEGWGVWSALASYAMPIRTLHVSEQGRFGRAKFSAKAMDLPALGYVVPFSALQRTLYDTAVAQPEVRFISIEKITALECKESGAQVEYVAAGKTHHISAPLLIAADGAHSTCRDLLHIAAEQSTSDDVAVIATLQCKVAHQGIAYQRFTRLGSLALLPLFDPNSYRLVWTMSKQQHEIMSSWSDTKLLNKIADAYGGRLGDLQCVQRDAVFPLQRIVADEMVRSSLVLLGNAAHTIYPIAAQGFNLGLQDVAALVRILKRARLQGESLGALSTLQCYVDRRTANQRAVIQWTDRVSKVFRWRVPILDHVRGLALLGLDVVPMVKENFARNFLHD